MKNYLAFLFFALFSVQIFASEVTIFDSRKPVSLSDDEKPSRDYYISGGSELGLKPGVLVTVTRRTTLYDAYENRTAGDLVVQVGKLRIIHVQKNLSVGRFYSLIKGSTAPILEDNFIMVGDRVDVGSAELEKSDKSADETDEKPIKQAATPPPLPSPVQVVVQAPPATPTFAATLSSQTPGEQQKPVAMPSVH